MAEAWREVRVVFIPKSGKSCYDLAKSFRPVSLTSFLLKTLEKMVDRHIRDETLSQMPVHHSQHAYQAGKSVESALHEVVSYVEKAFRQKESVFGVFIDIKGVFDNTPFEAICEVTDTLG